MLASRKGKALEASLCVTAHDWWYTQAVVGFMNLADLGKIRDIATRQFGHLIKQRQIGSDKIDILAFGEPLTIPGQEFHFVKCGHITHKVTPNKPQPLHRKDAKGLRVSPPRRQSCQACPPTINWSRGTSNPTTGRH